MHRIVTPIVLLAVLVFGASCMGACTNAGHGASNDHTALVVGTVVDAATGKPVADAIVRGPNGKEVRSDEHGRFELAALETGTSGDVKAKTSDGRSATVPLRHLSAGTLEVVLHLSRQ